MSNDAYHTVDNGMHAISLRKRMIFVFSVNHYILPFFNNSHNKLCCYAQ